MPDMETDLTDGPRDEIDWTMSAALENVPRGDSELAEVTSLASAVTAWLALDPAHRAEAVLTLDTPLTLEGARRMEFEGEEIKALADRLPANGG